MPKKSAVFFLLKIKPKNSPKTPFKMAKKLRMTQNSTPKWPKNTQILLEIGFKIHKIAQNETFINGSLYIYFHKFKNTLNLIDILRMSGERKYHIAKLENRVNTKNKRVRTL